MKRLAALAAVLLVAACGADPQPRPLSTAEAERLALARFANYRFRTENFTATVPTGAGRIALHGRVNFVERLGYAEMSTDGRHDDASAGLLQWTPSAVAFRGGPGQAATDPPPADRWQYRPLQQGPELDTALRLLLGLGADRPDNVQLLRQSSARWVRTDTVDETPVDVIDGPQPAHPQDTTKAARVRYWLDTAGLLRRVEARIGDRPDPVIVSFTPAASPAPGPVAAFAR
ncbi:hypothetical protein DMA12_12250 [Amycolatopsis balhimycina DSM 5908]|uniref:LppX_LprAFG lipoprotein n=1 Tax=Amycolatopsis balhimycina DSM 5908 TaxID=1081091 RepID=A0A428WSQ4_AMYBA|nr:hypothetical protein [Amycolatopsis balhimycina]RSM46050.1 hypothetical protein DMA12_12250 [Amycolatopsis balhimycina DSM 5908]